MGFFWVDDVEGAAPVWSLDDEVTDKGDGVIALGG